MSQVLATDWRTASIYGMHDALPAGVIFRKATSGVVHGVLKCAPLAGLRQVKQVMKKTEPLRRDRSFSDQTLDRTVS